MKYELENKVLTIYLKGAINSSNYEEIEKEIDEIINEVKFNSIRFDMEKLEYTSSAGLRIIIKIRKQYEDTSLINVPDNIYEILEMVNFTSMMEIKRK